MRICGLVMLCLLGVGCSMVQKPTAAVTGMALQNVDATGFTMNFDVKVDNPNAVALPLTAADYRLGLGGVNVVEGKAMPQGAIPAHGSRVIAVPVTLTYENLLTAEQSIVKGGGDVPYAFDGGLAVDTGNAFLGTLRVPLQYSGTLKLREILNNPQALIQSPAAQQLARQVLGGWLGR